MTDDLGGPSLPDSRLDIIEIAAKNRILVNRGDAENAADALVLVREVRQLCRVLAEQRGEIARLKAKVEAMSRPVAYGRCEAPECERATVAASRFCDIHKREVEESDLDYGRRGGPSAVSYRYVERHPGGRLGRSTPPNRGEGNGWDNSIRAMEDKGS